jgi:hypothetical protein
MISTHFPEELHFYVFYTKQVSTCARRITGRASSAFPLMKIRMVYKRGLGVTRIADFDDGIDNVGNEMITPRVVLC